MDIQKITAEIIATGMTQQQLADMVPCTQSMISDLISGKRGKRPSLKIGTRLMTLHSALCSGPVVMLQNK